jgi:hypothetical protein
VTADIFVRRIERRAARLAGVGALVALAARGGQPDWAAGVVGGWALVAGSAWLIRTSVERAGVMAVDQAALPSDGQSPSGSGDSRRGAYLGLGMRVTVRYALLAVAAYVMIGRLRLSPVGLLVGASSIVVSASIEAIRTLVSSRHI